MYRIAFIYYQLFPTNEVPPFFYKLLNDVHVDGTWSKEHIPVACRYFIFSSSGIYIPDWLARLCRRATGGSERSGGESRVVGKHLHTGRQGRIMTHLLCGSRAQNARLATHMHEQKNCLSIYGGSFGVRSLCRA